MINVISQQEIDIFYKEGLVTINTPFSKNILKAAKYGGGSCKLHQNLKGLSMKNSLLVTILLGVVHSQISFYDVGDIVTEDHQNITKSTCYSGNGYEVDDDWKLADWNGATNGGNYNVIFIDIQTTWCPP